MTLGHQQEELAIGPKVAMSTLLGSDPYLNTGEKMAMEKLTPPQSPTPVTHLEELPEDNEEILEVVEDQEAVEKPIPPGSSSRRSGGDVRSLLHFMSVAGGDIRAALDKSAPCKRSVDHRKYLQKQLCRLTAVVTTNPSPTPPAPAPSCCTSSLPSSPSGNHYQVLHPRPHMHQHHCPGATSEEASPSSCSPPPPTTPHEQQLRPTHQPVVATLEAPHSPSPSTTAVPRAPRAGAAQSSSEQLVGSSGSGALEDCGSGTDSRRQQAPHDDTSSRQSCDLSSCSPDPPCCNTTCITTPQVSNNSQQSPCQPEISQQSPGLEQAYLDEEHSQSNSPVQVNYSGSAHEQLPVLNLHVYGAVPPAPSEQSTSYNQGLTCNELLVLDVTGSREESSSLGVKDTQEQLLQGGNPPPLEKDPSVPASCAWSPASSPATDYRCMASTPAPLSPPLPLPPASVTGCSSNPSNSSPVSLPPSPISTSTRSVPTMVVAATPVPETTDAPHNIRHERHDVSTTVVKTPMTREGGGAYILPPEVTEDRDPLFEVPGVIDPTRAARDADGKDVGTAGTGLHQRASIPLRQRQLPASFWKEPRPEERRSARSGRPLESAGSTASDLLQAHGAFFVPYCSNPSGGLQGAKSHATYDNYKAMAELYGARYQEAAAAAAHRSAGTGPGAGGLSHPDYMLSAYGSKVPGAPGVTTDPTALSVVATAAAYHTGGLYSWPYSLLTGEAEKALAVRLQGSSVPHPGVQPHIHQHHQQHPHLQVQQQQRQQVVPQPHHLSLLNTSSSSVGAHPTVHGHALLYHRQSAAAVAAAAALTSHITCTSTAAVTSTASSRVVESPPGRGHLHGPGSSPPQAMWDPLAALTAQSLLRQQPPHSALWRPIPTKTLSSYQSRFHPFADVH